MSDMIMVYMSRKARTRLKALALMDNRNLSQYIEVLTKAEVVKVNQKEYKDAVAKVTDDNKANA